MKPFPIFIWITMFALSGCAHVMRINSDDTDMLARLNEHAADESAKIKFRDGKSIIVNQLSIMPDSASWNSLEGKGREATSTAMIQSVKITRHEKDIILVGSLAGAAAGALVSYNGSEGSWYREAVAGGMAGIGAVAGWFITSAAVGPRKEVYKFKTLPPDEAALTARPDDNL